MVCLKARRLVLLVALILLGCGTTATTTLPNTDPTILKPGHHIVGMIMNNMANRDVAVTGTSLLEVVAKEKSWTYLGPATFDLTVNPILHLQVTVKDNQGIAVTKPMEIDMAQTALTLLKGKKAVILTTVGDANGKILSIEIGGVDVLQMNL
jgi:hypothetical protein